MMMVMIHPPYDPASPLSSHPDVSVLVVDDDDDDRGEGGHGDAVDEKKTVSNPKGRALSGVWCTRGHYRRDPEAATRRCSSFNSTLSSLSSHQNTNTNNDTSPTAVTASLLCFNAPSWRWRGSHTRLLKLTKKSRKHQGSSEGSTAGSACSMAALAATRDEDLSINILLGDNRKQINPQQKREELEKEVRMLQKLLSQEETVHEILHSVHNRGRGSTISIPNFLPPKMKELLAELAMVEDEIARLECQISHLHKNIRHEKESKEDMIHSANPSPLNCRVPERTGFDTKALHFISKAIKGDYSIKDFRLMDKPESLFSDQKENQFVGEAKILPGKFWVSGGAPAVASYASLLRDLRHPTPKPREGRHETPLKSSTLCSKVEEEKLQKWEPNKLSESIMKCLNFIYIRLLRTSRAMEIEKLGTTISRPTQLNSSLNSRSFRAEACSGSKANPVSQRESRQADPYGVFDSEDAIPRDIGPYKNLVRFTASSMDPKCISSSSPVPLLKKLRELMTQLQKIDLGSLTTQQKLAFWINMYNACIMNGFLQYGVPSTPEKLLALLNKATLNVGGSTINAQAIEHFILRKPSSSNPKEIHWKGDRDGTDKEAMVRELYGLETIDSNIAFALCCGTRSSPAVSKTRPEHTSMEILHSIPFLR
ncbi:hypothetical protein SAY87_001879 [Trapa incisa]|uniref:Ternary complex factor MIP1 leucine-zipper domain-containing protein n=1 Tax=Trapa incisa TaxID=236973 RepID=A0AAN7JW32_9MYRT|nr:hypothetical protein SAY87_001879 [Trapa incisa]